MSVLETKIGDVWAGTLTRRIENAIAQGSICPDRFSMCFNDYPDVLIEIGRMAGISDQAAFLGSHERDYALGQQDLFKQIVTTASLNADYVNALKNKGETDEHS